LLDRWTRIKRLGREERGLVMSEREREGEGERKVRNCGREPGIVPDRGNSANFTILGTIFIFKATLHTGSKNRGVLI
jgi:hypothetical protein